MHLQSCCFANLNLLLFLPFSLMSLSPLLKAPYDTIQRDPLGVLASWSSLMQGSLTWPFFVRLREDLGDTIIYNFPLGFCAFCLYVTCGFLQNIFFPESNIFVNLKLLTLRDFVAQQDSWKATVPLMLAKRVDSSQKNEQVKLAKLKSERIRQNLYFVRV